MNYREIRATGPTAAFVDRFWVLNDEAGEAGLVQRVLPDGSAELVFNLDQPFESLQQGKWRSQPTCFLAGQITGSLLLRSTGRCRVLGVRFLPQGAGRLFGLPMEETANSLLPIADLSPALARGLDEARGAATLAGQFAWIQSALNQCERIHGRRDTLVDEAVRYIGAASGAVDLSSLAGHLGISLRHLERRFRNAVGLTPKVFSRIRRFQRVFQVVERETTAWVQVAMECGYYDQAHLIRDFQEFAGKAPAALLAGTDLAEHFLHRHGVSQFSKTSAGRTL